MSMDLLRDDEMMSVPSDDGRSGRFVPTGISFEDRIGPPDPTDAAIGRIALAYSFLEETARNTLILLAGVTLTEGYILTAPLSLTQKLDAIGGLVRVHLSQNSDEALQIIHVCRRAEELRNTYLGSSYRDAVRSELALRRGAGGLRLRIEPVSASLLLDVADYITSGAMELEGLPLVLDVADHVSSGADFIRYEKNRTVLATFRFGQVS